MCLRHSFSFKKGLIIGIEKTINVIKNISSFVDQPHDFMFGIQTTGHSFTPGPCITSLVSCLPITIESTIYFDLFI